ncbi:MAG: hypothetical protein FJW36_01170 [Acidobacteria bacterium]|nr:hypothetical protein [Acidobacteriota bacterium]
MQMLARNVATIKREEEDIKKARESLKAPANAATHWVKVRETNRVALKSAKNAAEIASLTERSEDLEKQFNEAYQEYLRVELELQETMKRQSVLKTIAGVVEVISAGIDAGQLLSSKPQVAATTVLKSESPSELKVDIKQTATQKEILSGKADSSRKERDATRKKIDQNNKRLKSAYDKAGLPVLLP